MFNVFIIVWLGITAFISTNMDNLVLLLMTMGEKKHKTLHVFVGYFICISFLVLVCFLCDSFTGLIPTEYVDYLGFIPITLGLIKLYQLFRKNKEEVSQAWMKTSKYGFLTVALLGIANGGDNVAVYIPLFADSSTSYDIVLIITFMAMTAVWCYLSLYISKRRVFGQYFGRYVPYVIPFFLVFIGFYILLDTDTDIYTVPVKTAHLTYLWEHVKNTLTILNIF